MSRKRIIAEKLLIARQVVKHLRERLGSDLLAAGVHGSVARGTAGEYSDIDLLIIVKRRPAMLPQFGIIRDTFYSLQFETTSSIASRLRSPSDDLPERLGGFTKVLPLYDPRQLFRRIERKTASIPANLFRKSAEVALLGSYEDFCRVKNAYVEGDEIVMKDNIDSVTLSAARVVASLNDEYFRSDRDIFKAHRKFKKLPKGYANIEVLRYGGLRGHKLFKLFLEFYLNLIRFCRKQGIRFPVEGKTLRKVDLKT